MSREESKRKTGQVVYWQLTQRKQKYSVLTLPGAEWWMTEVTSNRNNSINTLKIYVKLMHVVTTWHFLQAFPSLISFSFHSNQEDSISFYSPCMLLKTWLDQARHLTARTWQADILTSRVRICICFRYQGFMEENSGLFQTFCNTLKRWGFLKSVILLIRRCLALKYQIFNCSKKSLQSFRLRSIQHILKK